MHLAKITTFITAVVVVSSACIKAEPTATAKKDPKTISLFDGKTLKGWKKVGGNGEFKVEDGCIVGVGRNVRGNTFLRTEKTYGDFELSYEFKFDDLTGNSGLMFRAAQKPSDDGNGQVFGYQCEGDNGKDRAWTAGLYDEARRGWLFPDKKDKEQCKKFTVQGKKTTQWDGWNTIVIRCKGNHIQTWLNGEKRVSFIDTNKKHGTRNGFFGLQVHNGKSCNVRWRNLKLKQL